jgi:ATP-dependent helicase/nuclease subunit B
MTQDQSPNLYTIPPGVAFLPSFAEALLNGDMFPGFKYDPSEPHHLANIRIYVPTRRAVRSLRSELAEQIGKGSVILPDIRPLGEVEDDLGFFDIASNEELSTLDAISPIQSKLILGELILLWKQALPKAFHQQLKSVPMVAPANPTDAIWLADELLSLIESAESEEVDLAGIDLIDAEDHAKWWQLTLEFLKILREFWPTRLKELNRQSITIRQINMLDKQTEELMKKRHSKPVIVAGSTGSLPATARLIRTVSQLENGAVILPGLDQNMTPDQWQPIYNVASNNINAKHRFDLSTVVVQGHPQFGLARLLWRLGLKVEEFNSVKQLAKPSYDRDVRQKIISKAMLPVSQTQDWFDRASILIDDEQKACRNLTLIEAGNEREEAAAIATAIRLALEPNEDSDEPDVALITPDRNLARKVSIELLKFGITADDSGGISLLQTKLGNLTIICLHALLKAKDNLALAALLKHPFAHFGLEEEERLRSASVIERLVLRSEKSCIDPAFLPKLLSDNFDALLAQKHVPKWLRNISNEDMQRTGLLAQAVADIYSAFHGIDGQASQSSTNLNLSIGHWTRRTIDALEAITRSGDGLFAVWECDEGGQLARLLEEVEACPTSLQVTGREWCDMLDPLISGQTVKPKTGNHPRVMIWGVLEARLQNVDTMILAGLNEGTWPSVSSNDPFLSRSMKSEIGLIPPERRLGLAAHDFQIAAGTKRVVFTRSLKSSGAPTVASRWVQRLLTVLRPETVETIRKRGRDIVDYAELVPARDQAKSAQRPEPKPQKSFQPKSYSFSEVSTLRRDPYAIYARKILKLDLLENFASEPDLRLRGTIFHAIIENYSKQLPDIQNSKRYETFLNCMNSEFSKHDLPTDLAFLWKQRLLEVSKYYVDWEHECDQLNVKRHIELSARCTLPNISEIHLTGRADRIDITTDNSGGTYVDIIDFKTGTRPSAKEARSLLDPQLALEAFALEQGGFKGFGGLKADSLKYVRFKPSDHLIIDQVEQRPTKQNPDTESASDLGQRAADELSSLISALGDNRIGFLSRAIPVSEFDMSGDYDHLARVSEWSVAETSDMEDGYE